MRIELKIVKENPDGSANAMVNFDKEGLEFLVQEGLLSVMKEYIDKNENAKQGIALRKRTTTRAVRASSKVVKRKPKNNK